MSLVFKSIVLEKNDGSEEAVPIKEFVQRIDDFICGIRATATKKMIKQLDGIDATRLMFMNPDVVLSMSQSIWGPEVIGWRSDK